MASPEKHTILLVDDEALIREGLAHHLEECGYTVLRAASADMALPMLQDVFCPVDLVFTDVRMPGQMDGMDLVNWIVANRPHIPVIVASGNVSKEAAADQLCGAESVGKPFDYHLVTKKIRTIISRRTQSE